MCGTKQVKEDIFKHFVGHQLALERFFLFSFYLNVDLFKDNVASHN